MNLNALMYSAFSRNGISAFTENNNVSNYYYLKIHARTLYQLTSLRIVCAAAMTR